MGLHKLHGFNELTKLLSEFNRRRLSNQEVKNQRLLLFHHAIALDHQGLEPKAVSDRLDTSQINVITVSLPNEPAHKSLLEPDGKHDGKKLEWSSVDDAVDSSSDLFEHKEMHLHGDPNSWSCLQLYNLDGIFLQLVSFVLVHCPPLNLLLYGE